MLPADKFRAGVVAAAAAILCCQLFLPPIVGLADQGDFTRMTGRFGYGPEDKSAQYAFLARKFVPDPNARVRPYEQFSSEYIFVEAAILLNQVVSRDGKLDLTMIGFVHALAFLFAFYRLLQATGQVRTSPFIWLLALLVLTDVGYAAYWNSFYSEPAACIFFLLGLSESIAICRSGEVSAAQTLRWTLWAALFILAKPLVAPLGILLALFLFRLRAWSKGLSARRIAIAASLLLAAVSATGILSIPLPIRWANTYNQVFLVILPESKDPAGDARALGLPSDWLKYSGTGAWSPGTAYYDAVVAGVIGKTITPGSILRFYLLRPDRIWRHAKRILPVAFSLRPDTCGNFERSAGLAPGARSHSFDLWSGFHDHVIAPSGKYVLIALLLSPLVLAAVWLIAPSLRRSIELFELLALCCILAFLVAICGDDYDNIRHLFLFNLLLDTLLVGGTAMLFRLRPSLR